MSGNAHTESSRNDWHPNLIHDSPSQCLQDHPRRVAQAFDFAGIATTVGAQSFAHFAKGGYHERMGNGFCAIEHDCAGRGLAHLWFLPAPLITEAAPPFAIFEGWVHREMLSGLPRRDSVFPLPR
jgi:hypothetical protein